MKHIKATYAEWRSAKEGGLFCVQNIIRKFQIQFTR